MSRVGKKPIPLAKGVKITIGQELVVEGPKGKLAFKPHVAMKVSVEGGNVVLEVHDSGPGIPEALRTRILEPFFTTKPVGKGTGLGLPISLGIAQAHGGRLVLDQGSGHPSFLLELPRRQKK